MPCRKKWANVYWAITTTRLPAMKNYVKSVIGNLDIKTSPNAPVNMNSSGLSHGIWEAGGKNFSQTARVDI